MHPLTQIGLSTLAGLVITTGIGAATNTVSSTPARLAAGSQRHPVRAVLDRERLWKAFWMKEASGNPNPPRGKAGEWGIFQWMPPDKNGQCRWTECGGRLKDWGNAGNVEQVRVMRIAIRRYLRDCPKSATVEQSVAWVGRSHNGGKKRTSHNAYTRDLWKLYKGTKP
jgi:hypothetical protein